MGDIRLVEYEKAFELFNKDGQCLAHIWKIDGNGDILDLIMDHYQVSAEPYVPAGPG